MEELEMSVGIDYGMGSTNVNVKTGIRYGVISQHSIMCEAMDDFESDYGEAMCPKCGNAATECVDVTEEMEDWESAKYECSDYVCLDCKYIFGFESAFGEEVIGFSYEQDGYQLTNCLDSDIFVLASPFYTFAQYCSPCVPGAGNLDSVDVEGVKTYCLGHDWFEEGEAPYPVYSVETGKEVLSDKL